MDIAAFKLLYASAAPFVKTYEERQALTQIQISYRNSTECSKEEKALVDTWLTNNTKWLVDNDAKYRKCVALLALPKNEIEELYAAYAAIYGAD